MIRFITIFIVLVLALLSNAYPAETPVKAVELAADANADLADSAAATSGGDADLQGSETFGFGFYPGFYGGGYGGYGGGYGRRFGGYGGYGYGRRWGYGYGGGYGGYGGGYGGYYRPYPIFG